MKHLDYIERKRHGSPLFPIQYYFLTDEDPQYIMEAHWHKEFEIIRVLQGSFTVFLNSVEHDLTAGDVLFVQSGCLHRGVPTDCIYECLVFDPNMLRRQQTDAAEQYIAPIADARVEIEDLLRPQDDDIRSTVDVLFAAMRQEAPCYELEVYGHLFRLFGLLYSRRYVVDSAKPQQNRTVQRIISLIDWIDQNFAEPITLELLSARSGLSKKYLCRIFKEYTSKTLVSYINELRIENACFEMSIRDKSITQSAFDSGFNDLSYFCKLFKRYKGITPKEYKNQ